MGTIALTAPKVDKNDRLNSSRVKNYKFAQMNGCKEYERNRIYQTVWTVNDYFVYKESVRSFISQELNVCQKYIVTHRGKLKEYNSLISKLLLQ